MLVKWRIGGEDDARLADSILPIVPPVTAQVDLPDGTTVYVGSVNWYPWGEPDDDLIEPFVYIVLERDPVPDPMTRVRLAR
jgi:hypothetical protein